MMMMWTLKCLAMVGALVVTAQAKGLKPVTFEDNGLQSFDEVNGATLEHISQDEIKVSFEYDGHKYEHYLQRVRGIYSSETSVRLSSDPQGPSINKGRDAIATFEAKTDAQAIAVVTLEPSGSFNGLFQTPDGNFLKVESAEKYRRALGEERFRSLSKSSADYVAQTIKVAAHPNSCGHAESAKRLLQAVFDEEAAAASNNNSGGRRLGSPKSGPSVSTVTVDVDEHIASRATENRELADSCYPGDSVTHEVEIGVVVDKLFLNHFGSVDSTLLAVERTLSETNAIFKSTLKVVLTIKHLILVDQAVGDLKDFDECGSSVFKSQDVMSEYARLSSTPKAAIWHRLTRCNWGSVIGVAFLDGVCSNVNGWNTGVSAVGQTDTFASRLFVTFAHESAHLFNAVHTFGHGSIMDYNVDGKLPNGQVGFLPSSKNRMCKKLQEIAGSGGNAPCEFFKQKPDAQPVCGNRALEENEECECPNGSTNCNGCKDCKLTDPTRECSRTFIMRIPNSNIAVEADNHCCTNDGKLADASTKCPGQQGYCSLGKCVNKCNEWFEQFELCGEPAFGGCRQSCQVKGDPQEFCTPFWAKLVPGPKQWVGDLTDGAKCVLNSDTPGVCKAGVCSEAPKPETLEESVEEDDELSEDDDAEFDEKEEIDEQIPRTMLKNKNCNAVRNRDNCCKFTSGRNNKYKGQNCVPVIEGKFWAGRRVCMPEGWVQATKKEHLTGTCSA